MSRINWTTFAIIAIPGVVPFLMLHNFILYQEGPAETICDIIWSLKN